MTSNNILRACIIAAGSILLAASCDQTTGNQVYYTAYMTARQTQGQPYACYFISDDSIKIIPLNYYSEISLLETDDRLLASFTTPSGGITDPMEVEFTSMLSLVTQEILQTSEADTVSDKDQADIRNIWHSGGIDSLSRFITISFDYLATDAYTWHEIHLVDDLNESNPDSDGYYHLSFRHNADSNGMEFSEYTSTSVATYLLPEKYTAPGIKGLKISYNSITESSDSVAVLNY